MTVTEGLSIASGLVIGYWFVSNFVRPADPGTPGADREAARERPGPPGAPGTDTPQGPAPPPWHEVLEVAADADDAAITAAYRRRISQYHPDRVARMGPEIRALAEARCREINRAYEDARRGR